MAILFCAKILITSDNFMTQAFILLQNFFNFKE